MLKIYLTYFLFLILILNPNFLWFSFIHVFISHDLFLFLSLSRFHSLSKYHCDSTIFNNSSPLCLQSRRCFNGWDSPAKGHRQLCPDGAPGCTAVPGITAPHCPHAHFRLCGSQQSPDSKLAQTQLRVNRLKLFSTHF